MQALIERVSSCLPEGDWEARREALLSPHSKTFYDSLLQNPHFKTLTQLAGFLDVDLRGVKRAVADGCGPFIDTELAKAAQIAKQRAILCVSLTFTLFQVARVIMPQVDCSKRRASIHELRAALAEKKSTRVPRDVEDVLVQCEEASYQPAAPASTEGGGPKDGSGAQASAQAAEVAAKRPRTK